MFCTSVTVHWTRVDLGIVERHVDFHAAEVDAPKALRELRRVAHRAPVAIEPYAVSKAVAGHDQRVPVPAADRVPVERRRRIVRQRPSIHEHLPIGHVALGQDHEEIGKLEELPERWKRENPECAARATEADRIVPSQLLGTLLDESLGPRLVRQTARHLCAEVDELGARRVIRASFGRARPRLELPDA